MVTVSVNSGDYTLLVAYSINNFRWTKFNFKELWSPTLKGPESYYRLESKFSFLVISVRFQDLMKLQATVF